MCAIVPSDERTLCYHKEVTTEDRALCTPSRTPSAAVVVFSGELDIASKEALREQLDRFSVIEHLCLDFAEVAYMDSTVIGEMIRLHKSRVERGLPNEVVVIGQNQPIRRLFRILHLESVFQVRDAVPDLHRAGRGEDVVRTCLSVRDGVLTATNESGAV
jgi:anti-anti-sigma factor